MIIIENFKNIIATLEEVEDEDDIGSFIATIPVEKGMIIEIKKDHIADMLKLLNYFNITLHKSKDDNCLEFLVSKKQELNQISYY